MDNIISAAMGLIVILIVLIILGSCIKVVPQSRAFVVERLGAFRTVWGVGLHIKVPLFERVAKNVSLKEQVVDFPPQPVITKDNVTMQIDTVIYFQITDPKLYAYGVENPMSAIENLTATTLRNIITDHTDISVLLCQQIDQLKLYKVRVLVLVHHDIPEFILIIFQHIRVCLEKFYRFHQQIVKIQGIILLEFFLVFPVNLSNLFLPEVRSRLLLKLIRRDPVIFRRRNP